MKWPFLKERKIATSPRKNTEVNRCSTIIYVSNQTQISQLKTRVVRVLSNEVLAGSLSARILPVLLNDQQVVIFVTNDFSASDVLDLVVQQLDQHGYVLASVWHYVVPLTLLLELSRDHTLYPKAKFTDVNETTWTQADLYVAFLDIVRWAIQHKASDIHISIFFNQIYSEVRFTILGRYISPRRYHGLRTAFLLDMLSVAWMQIRGGNGAVFDPYKEQQGSLLCEIDQLEVRLRWGALAAETGPSVCLRILSRDQAELPTLDALGYLPTQIQQLKQAVLDMQGGAIVFSGAVGSGKTTSLAALVSLLPDWRKLISLEDPVEYSIPSAIQIALSRDLDQEAHDLFATKLRAIKRSAMSDVLLGEIRDIETGRAFTDLSSSGVRLYTTVHAGSAALIPARLGSDFIGVSSELLATPSVLRLLVHQCLLPRLCTYCSLLLSDFNQYPHAHAWHDLNFTQWRKRVELLVGSDFFSSVRLRNKKGCEKCVSEDLPDLSGWAGRVVCAEILDPMQLEKEQLKRGLEVNVEENLTKSGWKDIRNTALTLVRNGVVDPFDTELFFSSFFDPRWQTLRE